MTNPLELAIVENYAVARGARMRGLRGLGDTRAAVANELGSALSIARTRNYNPADPETIPGYGDVERLWTQYLQGDQRADVDPSEVRVVRAAISQLNPPWFMSNTLTGGGIANWMIVAGGAGALALAAGAVFYWRKRR